MSKKRVLIPEEGIGSKWNNKKAQGHFVLFHYVRV